MRTLKSLSAGRHGLFDNAKIMPTWLVKVTVTEIMRNGQFFLCFLRINRMFYIILER